MCQKDTQIPVLGTTHEQNFNHNKYQPSFSLFQHPSIPFFDFSWMWFPKKTLDQVFFLPKAMVQKSTTTQQEA